MANAFGINFDTLSIEESVSLIFEWIEKGEDSGRYVVTPNVDHVLLLDSNDKFKLSYDKASLRLVDGWPVAKFLSFSFGKDVKTVPGSDLVPALLDKCSKERPSTKVFLLGGLDGVGDAASHNIKNSFPGSFLIETYSPPFGFEYDNLECSKILRMVNDFQPDILVIGLGAPKQEIWIHAHHNEIKCGVAICAGATIDFIAGSKSRAPVAFRKMKIEWLYRMLQEPRRLFPRYFRGAILFPILSIKEFLRIRLDGRIF